MVELRISPNFLSPFSHQLSWTCQPRPPRRSTQLPGAHSCLSSHVSYSPLHVCAVWDFPVFSSLDVLVRPCLSQILQLHLPPGDALSVPDQDFNLCPPDSCLLAQDWSPGLIVPAPCLTVHQPPATLVFGLVVCLPRVSVNRWTFSTGADSFVLHLGSHTTCHALSFGLPDPKTGAQQSSRID